MQLKYLPFLVFLFICSRAEAQMGKLFNTDNQLSSNQATQVFQDRDGFIWIATHNGLNRYDGYQFHIFKREDEASGLQSNYINCITQSRSGIILIGSNQNVQAFDGARFHDFDLTGADGKQVNTYINYITESSEGYLLVCTSGYGIFRLDENSSTGTFDSTLTADNLYVRFLLEDTFGRHWIVTETDGLVLAEGQRRTAFFTEEDCRAQLREIRQDYKGNIYAAVRGKGVYVYDDVHRSFRFLEKTRALPVNTLCPCRDGRLLIGCDGCGVVVYDPQTDSLVDNPFFSRELNLAKSKTYSILEDRNGNIWMCLLQKGIFMQPKAKMDFGYLGYRLGDRNVIGTNCVSSTLIDSHGRVWVGTDKDGLYLIDKDDFSSARHFTACPSTILSMAEDAKGNIWLGSYGEGCGWIDPQSGQWHPANLSPGSSANVFGLAADASGDVWIATMGSGLVRYNVISGNQTTFKMHDGADTCRTVNSLPNNYLSKLCLAPDGKRLFIACPVGLCCYDIEHDSWVKTFGSNCPNYGTFSRDVYVDRRDRVWLGTVDGLYCYDLRSGKESRYTSADGLPADGIASVIDDLQGNLWLGTDHGLCCFNPTRGTSDNYYVDNGLQGSEFSDGAVSMSERGALLFGGTGGINWFNPADVKPQEWKANVCLTGFILGHTPVTPGVKSGMYTVTDTSVINADRFDLSSDAGAFILQLSTFTYDNPEHITYLYSINGGEWIRLQTGVNEITFNGMAPGTYRFRVKAINNQQETDVRQFTLKIHSPWYASVWAWIFYLLLGALGVWLLLLNRRRKERHHLQLQEHIHAEQMADAKLRFFMNISHEIRTPMTLIVTPLQSLIKKDNDPQRRGVYETMRRNAQRILSLINQMMDLRKIDKGQMFMRMCETDLIGFVDDIYAMFALQAKTKNIHFTFLHDDDALPVWIDRSNFDKVIVNILSNAFKFTSPGGEIRISVSHDDSQARIAVYDNGKSIPDDVMPHIFERFYQQPSNSSDSHVGTGIGLDLTRALVELHHGNISVHNNADGPGCEFVVVIPLGNAHLTADEMITPAQAAVAEVVIDEGEEKAEEPVNELPNPGRRHSLVIVEDDYEIREALAAELRDDYDVTACENGMEGLKQIVTTPPDLVISDVMMPEMDGNALCSKIKANPATNHIPVILVTAKNSDEDQLEGLETGADAYIVKPYNMDILRRTVINLLNRNDLLRMKYGRTDQLEEQVDDLKVKSPDDKLLDRIMAVINKNIGNDELSVDRIANEVGISRVHLHRKMKELTGQTPHEFILSIRLKQAAQLLANQGMNITEVMYACGFNNSASFSTIFKRFYGVSPREYMREHQKKAKN